MLSILARKGWKPAPAQTSREFAEFVVQHVQTRNGGADVAEVVRQTSTLFERVRYGDVPLTEEESARVNSRLELLASRLAAREN
jgi:hypothetical protein